MRNLSSWLILVVGLSVMSPRAEAKAEKIGKLSFELGEPWKCDLEGAELVCVKSGAENPPKEMIVITSRERSKDDTLMKFKAHLKEQRKFNGPDGAAFKSEVKYTKEVRLGGLTWIDSLQYQSEIPGYFTRYFATVDGNTAVVATFSAKKETFEILNSSIPKWLKTFSIHR